MPAAPAVRPASDLRRPGRGRGPGHATGRGASLRLAALRPDRQPPAGAVGTQGEAPWPAW